MSTLVFLDTGPLGMATNPRATEQTERCSRWLEGVRRVTHGVNCPRRGPEFRVDDSEATA